jgi:acetyl esterase/lipase
MDPATHRFTTSALAKHSGGRCFSVRYRLAPQDAFPAALLDALVAYLSLLSPPQGSFHAAVCPSRIIIAGDSSGAGLATSLLLLLLTFRRLQITHIRFHGKDVDISGIKSQSQTSADPPVAGLAVVSPWLDVSRSLPSVHRNAKWDIIAAPSKEDDQPCPNFPSDAIWPTQPPRVETYCEANLVSHPLVSPLAASAKHWVGAPPVYLCVGWEALQDETEVLARRLDEVDVTVAFDGYEGMPHCFSMVPWNSLGITARRKWAHFCRDAVQGSLHRREHADWTDKAGAVKHVKFCDLGMSHDEPLDDITVNKKLAQQRDRRERLEKQLRANCDYYT